MKFSSTALATLFVAARSASAFAPAAKRAAFVPQQRTRTFTSTSSLNANVLKLADPAKEILDKVDVFIFDCDGVIWKVRYAMLCSSRRFEFYSSMCRLFSWFVVSPTLFCFAHDSHSLTSTNSLLTQLLTNVTGRLAD
jgi:hypothetical protein